MAPHAVREPVIAGIASVTRRMHPRGTDRIVRRIHGPDDRTWSIERTVRLRNGIVLRVDTASFPEWYTFFYGEWEPGTTALIERVLQPGQDGIDVGANTGILTASMARAAGEGRVIACEPNPPVADKILANMELNGLDNVNVVRAAVTDFDGQLTLYLPDPDSLAHQHNASAFRHADNERSLKAAVPTEVRAMTVDSIVAAHGLSNLGLIKVDVEGLEAPVLRGAREVLASQRPALIFEHEVTNWEAAGNYLHESLAYLRGLGYQHFRQIRGNQVVPLDTPPYSGMNVFASVDSPD